jgi:hypothetical protein
LPVRAEAGAPALAGALEALDAPDAAGGWLAAEVVALGAAALQAARTTASDAINAAVARAPEWCCLSFTVAPPRQV